MMFRKYQRILVFSLCLLLLAGCGKEEKRKETRIYLSPKALAAKYFIDNELPEEQRQAFYTGVGDKANMIANLMSSGHLEGAAEYQEALEKLKEDK